MLTEPTEPTRATSPQRSVDPVPAHPAVGGRIGRYVVLSELGRGGMGVVLHAYDPKLQREVALKVVRSDRFTAEAQVRLLREAQSMAQLSHPNVVGVFDVELNAAKSMVIAMEYVRGQTLARWLEDDRAAEAVLDVLVAAGRGLAAAHEAGLLHRDFKPSNVLVGDEQRVCVTDFGLARSHLGSPDSGTDGASPDSGPTDLESQSLTRTGTVMGTPGYMAPEQHQSRPLDPRTDQYAFCVTAWQALTGTLPFDGRGEALLEAKLAGPPPWPSNVEVVVSKGVVRALFRGLAPDPEQRFTGMDALLHELARDRARSARWMVTLAGAAVLIGGSVAITRAVAPAEDSRCTGSADELGEAWSSTRRAAVREALHEAGHSVGASVWTHALRSLTAYTEQWVATHQAACEATTVRGEASPRVLDLRMGCLRRARMQLGAATSLMAEADLQVVLSADRIIDALPDPELCLQVDADGHEPYAQSQTPAVVDAMDQLAEARVRLDAGKPDDAEPLLDAAASGAADSGHPPLEVELELAYGRFFVLRGDYAQSQQAYQRALRSALARGLWSQGVMAASGLTMVVGQGLGDVDGALAHANVGWGLLARGEWDAMAGHLHNNVAVALEAAGRYTSAKTEAQAAVARLTAHYGALSPKVATARNNLGNALHGLGDVKEAEAEYRQALTLWRDALGPDHPRVSSALNNLAILLEEDGRHAEAEQQYKEALRVVGGAQGVDHPKIAAIRLNLGGALMAQQRLAEAEVEFREALEIRLARLPPEHPEIAGARNNLALALERLGRIEDAEGELRAAVIALGRTRPPDHPDVLGSQGNLAAFLRRNERGHAESLELLETIWSVRRAGAGTDGLRARAAFELAQALGSAGVQPERAIELAERARDLLTATKTTDAAEHAPAVAEIDQWLRARRSGQPRRSP